MNVAAPLLIAMAGLPGTGKSTVARRLAAALGGAVIDKDAVRQALFGEPWTEYSTAQDDFVLTLMLAAAERLIARQNCPAVFLDGRTFSRAYQLDMVRVLAARAGCRMRIIECVCEPEVALERIRRDAGTHPASNRDDALYWQVREQFEPVPEPKLVIDTGLQWYDDTLPHRLVTE
jgi:predicted kinase